MIKVSIIVPIYNAQDYIKRCLDALVEQDFQRDEFEILCIDDCSKDKSVEYLKEYEKQYTKIKCYYNEKNRGVSYSRNLGIQKAKGEYLAFCDADDWYDKNSISAMYKKAVEEQADLLISNYYIDKGKHSLKRCVTGNFTRNPIPKGELIKYMDISSSAKLIKKKILVDNKLSYPVDLRRCEEYEVIPVAAYFAERVVYTDDYTYHYFQNPKSASNFIENNYDFFEIAFERYSRYVSTKEYQKEIKYRAIEHLLYGENLCMIKARASSKQIRNNLAKFEMRYGILTREEYREMGISRRVFLGALRSHNIWLMRILAKIHSIITG